MSIRNTITGAASAAALLAGASGAAAQDYDVLIRDGRVLDGTGAPWRHADVAVNDDRIVAVGDIPGEATADLRPIQWH